MLATPVRENGSQPMVGNYENEVHYTREEFMDELAKQFDSNQKLSLILPS